MRCVLLLLPALCAAAILLLGSQAHAAIAPPDGINYAFVQMQFVEISKIDGVEQAFHGDFFMLTSWLVDATGTNWTVDSDLTKDDLRKNFWSPSLEFINARSEITRLVDEPFAFSDDPGFLPVEVPDMAADGYGRVTVPFTAPPGWLWVQEDQRYQCDFTTPLRMQAFPYDEQFVQLQVESYWGEDQLIIVWAQPEKIHALLPDSMPDIVGWTSKNSVYFSTSVEYVYNEAQYNRLTIRTLATRQPAYYLTKIVTGSILLVYMGIWVFSLQVDEADRMMGSLSIFAGLITFLFVAGEDTPKVPYQTRLDVFMMFSFLTVATMVFLHGALYFFRECDIEDALAEQQKDDEEAGGGPPALQLPSQKQIAAFPASSGSPQHSLGAHGASFDDMGDIELQARPSSAITPNPAAAAAAVNDSTADPAAKPNNYGVVLPHIHHPAHGHKKSHGPKWQLRSSLTAEFSLRGWFAGLHLTRKFDAVIIPALSIIYGIGVLIIFGRSTPVPNMLPYQ